MPSKKCKSAFGDFGDANKSRLGPGVGPSALHKPICGRFGHKPII